MENNEYSGIKNREYLKDSERLKNTVNKSLFFLFSTPVTANLFNYKKQKQKNLQVNTSFSQSKIFNKTTIKFQNEEKTTGFLILQTVFFSIKPLWTQKTRETVSSLNVYKFGLTEIIANSNSLFLYRFSCC